MDPHTPAMTRHRAHTKEITALLALNNPDQRLTGSADRSIRLWSLNKTIAVFSDPRVESEIATLCYRSLSDSILCTAGPDLFEWRVEQSRPITLKAQRVKKGLSEDELNDLKLSEDQSTLALATDDQEVLVLDYSSLEIRHTFRKHENICFRVVFSTLKPQSELFSAGFDFNVIHWNFDKGERLRTRRIEKTLVKHNLIPLNELPYNPPYTYEMKTQTLSDLHLLLLGLGNGALLILDQNSLQFYKYFPLHGLPLTHLLLHLQTTPDTISDQIQEAKTPSFEVLSICQKGEGKWLRVTDAWSEVESERVVNFPFKINCICGGGLQVYCGSPDENCLYEFQIK